VENGTNGATMVAPSIPFPQVAGGVASGEHKLGQGDFGVPSPGNSRFNAASNSGRESRAPGRRALGTGQGTGIGVGYGYPGGGGSPHFQGAVASRAGRRSATAAAAPVAGSRRFTSFGSVGSAIGPAGATSSPWSDPLFGLEAEMSRAADAVAEEHKGGSAGGAGGAVALLSNMIQSVQTGVAGALGRGLDDDLDADGWGWFEGAEEEEEDDRSPTLRRVDRLLVLLDAAMTRVGAIMTACTLLFGIRAVLFMLGPVGNVQLHGGWSQAFYPWFFYTLPELVCGCMVLILTAPHGEAYKGNACAGCIEGIADVGGCVSCGCMCCCFCCCCPSCRPESLSSQSGSGAMPRPGNKTRLPTVRQLELQGGRFAMRHGREVVERFTRSGIPLAMDDRDVGSSEDEMDVGNGGGKRGY